MAAQIRFVFESLDVITIAASKEFPIQVARVVAGRVLAILGELDGETVIRTAMETGEKAFDNRSGPQLQVLDAHQGRRIEPTGGGVVGYGRHCVSSEFGNLIFDRMYRMIGMVKKSEVRIPHP